jgi:hypothetical protein
VVGQKAGWATAWRPGPATEAGCTCAGCAARGHRTQPARSPAASRRQGLRLEHHDYAADAPGKESGGGAHLNSGASVGQWGGAATFDGGGVGTVVADDAAEVLHHGERKRRVRWGSRRVEEARASGTPSEGTVAIARWKIGEGSGDFGVRGRWTESKEDGGGGGVLELGRDGAK